MTILDQIVRDTRTHVAEARRTVPLRALEERMEARGETRSLAKALKQDHLAIIAELKKKSPSEGILRSDFDPGVLAGQYAAARADAISVLTEPKYFGGAVEHMERVRPVVDMPLIRKDFVVDVYQLAEARACGADAVLLIAAVLEADELRDLQEAAHGYGLECLVEVYDARELDKLDFDRVTILGVNNRDLRTFKVDINHSLRVFAQAPAHLVRVSESGLNAPAELAHLRVHGVDAVLIGTSFMRTPHPGSTLATLRERTETLVAQERAHPSRTPTYAS